MDGQQPYYLLDGKEVLRQLRSTDSGLTTTEAIDRLRHTGSNRWPIEHSAHWLINYALGITDWTFLLLLASSGVALYLNESQVTIILIILAFLNLTISFLQEFKAKNSLLSLHQLLPERAQVYRDGKLVFINTTDLVPGDIVKLAVGMIVPADIRLLSTQGLAADDTPLTGASGPIRKFARTLRSPVILAQRHNQVYMGTIITEGEAEGVVTATGQFTELGQVATMQQHVLPPLSPLQKLLRHLSTRLVLSAIILCALLLIPLVNYADLSQPLTWFFATAITLSLLPLTLPGIINTILSRSSGQLVSRKLRITRLSAIDTLGATDVLISRKSRLLTTGRPSANQLLIGKTKYEVDGLGYDPKGNITEAGKNLSESDLAKISLLLEAGALASDANIIPPNIDHTDWHAEGDATDAAFITLAQKAGLSPTDLQQEFPPIRDYIFDASRQNASTIRTRGNELNLFIKGSPSHLLADCTQLWDHGLIRKLSAKDRQLYTDYYEAHSAKAERVIAVAYRVLPTNFDPQKTTADETEKDLILLGLVVLSDPLRRDVPAAMADARKAQVNVALLTSDYPFSARALAVQASLVEHPEQLTVVSGEQLHILSDSQILNLTRRGGAVLSKLDLADELRIIKLAQSSGLVVTMTGRSIEDIPALTMADVGVALSNHHDQTTSSAADMVLEDNDLTPLLVAIRHGRSAFMNIQKASLASLAGNSAQLVTILASLGAVTYLSIPAALSLMQILAIDSLAVFLPLAALGWDKPETNPMTKPPRNTSTPLVNGSAWLSIMWCGLLIGSFAFINYLLFFWQRGLGAEHIVASSQVHMQATSLAFLTIVLCLLANILQRRSSHGLFSHYQLHNKRLWAAMALSLIATTVIIYIPHIAVYFQTGPLDFTDWIYALLAAVLFTFIREFQLRSRHQTRKSLLADYRPEVIKKHLKPINK
ncbi:MAG: cation-transporting P-type ATPase [Candidatus Saccharimonadales bacterium]